MDAGLLSLVDHVAIALIVGLPAIIAAVSSIRNGEKLERANGHSERAAGLSRVVLSEVRQMSSKPAATVAEVSARKKSGLRKRRMPRRKPPAQPAG